MAITKHFIILMSFLSVITSSSDDCNIKLISKLIEDPEFELEIATRMEEEEGRIQSLKNKLTATTTCNDLLENFNEALANYSKCQTTSAPSRFCRDCRVLYIQVNETFGFINKVKDEEKNVTCLESLDAGEMVKSLHDEVINGIWETKKCKNCFENVREGRSPVVFEALFAGMTNTSYCFDGTEERSMICEKCGYTYQDTMYIWRELVKPMIVKRPLKEDRRVCMDINLSMNDIWDTWNPSCHKKSKWSSWSFWICFCVCVFTLPIFYFTIWICHKDDPTEVVLIDQHLYQEHVESRANDNRERVEENQCIRERLKGQESPKSEDEKSGYAVQYSSKDD